MKALTIIKVLVVIVIIAGFWETLFRVFDPGGVHEASSGASAKNDEMQIVTAVKAFYTEYGFYPVSGANKTKKDAYYGPGPMPVPLAGTAVNMGSNAALLDVLRYNISGANGAIVAARNPRKIVFYDPPAVKDISHPASGVIPNGSPNAGAFFDPWGSPYNILIDADYDLALANPYSDSPGGTVLSAKAVIAWSFGKNGVLGGGPRLSSDFSAESGGAGFYYFTPYKSSDPSSGDVISWQ